MILGSPKQDELVSPNHHVYVFSPRGPYSSTDIQPGIQERLFIDSSACQGEGAELISPSTARELSAERPEVTAVATVQFVVGAAFDGSAQEIGSTR